MNPVRAVPRAIRAVLFDRDGTLVEDVPYNGDPDRVRPVADAREAVELLRAEGIGTAVVTNQSGVARGLIRAADVRRVNERVDALLGPFDAWAVCPHGPEDGCPCRKPRPGLIHRAADRMGVRPGDVVVIGDIGADMEAARRAGAHGILVPTPVTRPEETAAAGHVAPNLLTAVRAVLSGPPWGVVLADQRPIRAAYRQGRPFEPARTTEPTRSAGRARSADRAGPVRSVTPARTPGRPATAPAHDDGRRSR
ncbi:D-glycero-alpha-D-manno-heptose-1,7-bisphosphate 7-phosphatase [Streptomyces sp. NPDC015220]|uniref:D-glycero-alpha-D-manno-heptose-1,7-bisphosphate 7-phosphatase n=1 Tax=Streptomyces sp. NPDC015220 TaxID=3364947 RepID=UPI003700A42A